MELTHLQQFIIVVLAFALPTVIILLVWRKYRQCVFIFFEKNHWLRYVTALYFGLLLYASFFTEEEGQIVSVYVYSIVYFAIVFWYVLYTRIIYPKSRRQPLSPPLVVNSRGTDWVRKLKYILFIILGSLLIIGWLSNP